MPVLEPQVEDYVLHLVVKLHLLVFGFIVLSGVKRKGLRDDSDLVAGVVFENVVHGCVEAASVVLVVNRGEMVDHDPPFGLNIAFVVDNYQPRNLLCGLFPQLEEVEMDLVFQNLDEDLNIRERDVLHQKRDAVLVLFDVLRDFVLVEAFFFDLEKTVQGVEV